MDFLSITNRDRHYVNHGNGDPGSCVLMRNEIEMSGDRELGEWECMENNINPGVDPRGVMTDASDNPLTEKARRNTKKKYTPIP